MTPPPISPIRFNDSKSEIPFDVFRKRAQRLKTAVERSTVAKNIEQTFEGVGRSGLLKKPSLTRGSPGNWWM